MKWVIAALVFVAVAALYLPALDTAYVWDDHVLVEQDARCKGDLAKCFSIPFFPASPLLDASPAYYRPFVTVSFALAGGPRTQHGLNVVLHALNALLLYALMRRYRASAPRAAIAAMIWALHPRLVEAVTWVSGRTDVMCATFAFAALLVWPEHDASDERRRLDPARAVATSVLLFLALATKEVAIAAVLALVLTSWRTRARLPYLVVPALAYLALRISVVGLKTPPSSLTLADRIATIFEALARNVETAALFFSPTSARGAIGVPHTLHVASGVLVAFAIAFIAIAVRRSKKEGATLGAALAITSLLAVVHIVPIGLHGAVTADRLLYMPLAGVVVALATALPQSKTFERAGLAVCAVATLAFGAITRNAIHDFDDEAGYWLMVTERADPSDTGPRGVLASVVRDRGVPELACPLFEASRRVLEKTNRRAMPAYRTNAEKLAACWALVGRYDESADLLRALSTEHPKSARVALELGYAELRRFAFDAADIAFARSGVLDPQLRPLATRMREAIEDARHERGALEADPARRARFLASVGRGADAEREWLGVAKDASAPRGLRLEALRYLAADGRPDAAKAALEAVGEPSLALEIDRRRALAETVNVRAERISRCGVEL